MSVKISENIGDTQQPLRSAPYLSILFILLYGSGFIAAKIGLLYAPPFIFLAIRFTITVFLLLIIAYYLKSKWPTCWHDILHIAISGLLLLALFSVGTWQSMKMGLSPAISSLIISLQPLLVAIFAHFFLSEKIKLIQWIGLLLGIFGIILTVGEKVSFSHQYFVAVLLSVAGLVGLTSGSLYQKYFCSKMDVITGGIIQSLSAGIICLILGLLFEPLTIRLTKPFAFSLLWMSIIVSIGAISILYILLKHKQSSQAASMFYLVPLVTALFSYLFFSLALDIIQIIGMTISILGVSLVNFSFKRRIHHARNH